MSSSNSGGGYGCSPSMKKGFFDCKGYTKTHNIIRWKSGKRVDPRLLALLEPFGEIYVDRHELFRKIFQEDNHEQVFKKIGDALKRKKEMKKERGLSRSISIGEVRLERFKVRTPNVIVVGSESDGTTDQPAQGSSKD